MSNSNEEEERPFIQLINDDGDFTDMLPTYLAKHGLLDKGLNYSLMAVFGPQSSGKSTLLNALFNTQFTTMNMVHGRYQVTKGVCVSKAKNEDLLVLDLEGTDSKERGEENVSFEKKISLFALAISEVLLVNMWFQDIGRYNASNYALLKTVFELNLQLFQKNKTGKTLLLFTIRDHDDRTPMDALEDQLMKDIQNIWNSLIRPDEFKSSLVSDFFDFEFVGLPHKVYREKDFFEEVDKLRDRFVNPSNNKYLFQAKYKKNVPIDGFQFYASSIWETILKNKDLDLPTQKEMLAMYRCGAISNEVYAEFENKVVEWGESVRKKKLVTKLGKEAEQAANLVIDSYTAQTALYAPAVVDLKKAELLERMKAAVHDVFRSQLLLIRENAVQAFKKLLSQVVRRDSVLLDFEDTVQKIKVEILAFFDSKAQEAIYPGEEWDSTEYRDQLIGEIERHIEDERAHQVRILTDNEKQLLADNMKSGLSDILKSPKQDFWQVLRKFLYVKVEEVKEHLRDQLEGFNVKDKDVEDIANVLKVHAKIVLQGFIEGYVNQLTLRMNNKYDELFKFNGQIARSWRSEDEIRNVHSQAVQEALLLLDIFFLNRLDNPEYDHIHLKIPSQDLIGDQFKFPDEQEVITKVKKYRPAKVTTPVDEEEEEESTMNHPQVEALKIEEEFNSKVLIDKNTCSRMHTDFIVRVQSNVQNAVDRYQMLTQRQSIPWWIFLVILVLGWNEIMYFLSKPFYVLIALIFGIFFFWGYLRNRIQEYLQEGSNEMVKIVLRIVLEKLDALTESALGTQIQAVTFGTSQRPSESNRSVTATATSDTPVDEEDKTPVIVTPSSPTSTSSPFDDVSSGDASPQTTTDLRARRKPVLQKGMSRGSVIYSTGTDSKLMKDLQSKINSEMNME